MHEKELVLSQLSPHTASEVTCALASAALTDAQAQLHKEGDLRVRVLKLSRTLTNSERNETHRNSLINGVATIFGRRAWERFNHRTERTEGPLHSFGRLRLTNHLKKQSQCRPSEAISVLLRVVKPTDNREGHSTKEKTAFMSSRSAWVSKIRDKERSIILTSTASLDDVASSDLLWDEEFIFENIDSCGELQLFCVDRLLNEPHFHLPMRGQDIASCNGFLGRVGISLNQLPPYEEIEQWYPVATRDVNASLVFALRVSVCYTPRNLTQVRFRSLSVPELMEHTNFTENDQYASRKRFSNISFDRHDNVSEANNVISDLRMNSKDPETRLQNGVIDYVLIVGSGKNETSAHIAGESSILFRYPPSDRQHFRLPTKIEWFCQPNGPQVVHQQKRPISHMSSFLLSGGSDGLSRSFGICLNVYQRCQCFECIRERNADVFWHATCICLITRIPLLEQVRTCLLALVHTWITDNVTSIRNPLHPRHLEQYMVDLCHGILQPVRGVYGVQFTMSTSTITMLLPSVTSRHPLSVLETIRSKTPSSLPLFPAVDEHRCIPTDSMQALFPPVAYTLAPLFALFNVREIIDIVALTLLEYRIVIHSTNMAVLCPVAEAICTLLYPFRWQHPYVPVLPRYLLDYLQAPLPYMLGLHSSWLPMSMETSLPEHLVLVDCDCGCVTIPENESSCYTTQRSDFHRLLPSKLTRQLTTRLASILTVNSDAPAGFHADPSNAQEATETYAWSDQIEQRIRLEFVIFHATVFMGYRDCLFFVNHKLPVFNKHRFVTSCLIDSEVFAFVSRLLCTQSFQTFLENHNSAEMDTFHSLYVKLVRSSALHHGTGNIEASLDLNVLLKRAWYPDVDTGFLYPFYTSAIGMQRAPTTPIYTMPSLDPPASQSRERDILKDGERVSAESQSNSNHTQSDNAISLWEQSLQTIAEIDRMLDTRSDVPSATAFDEESLHWHLSRHFSLEINALDGWERDMKAYRTIAPEHLCECFQIDADALHSVFESQRPPSKPNPCGDPKSSNSSDMRLQSPIPISTAMNASWSKRHTSPLEQRIEQLLYKSLTAIFSSDVSLPHDELNSCELHFRHEYARDLFVLILMQPGHRFVEQLTSENGNPSTPWNTSTHSDYYHSRTYVQNSTTWYNPKGSGSCIGEQGFDILVRLSSYLMNECHLHEDFHTARRMLKVASHYYHMLDEKKSSSGFARKEYLVTALKLCPICQSLDMWQHAFTHDLQEAMLSEPNDTSDSLTTLKSRQSQLKNVSDQVFFSVSGNLIYSMLMVQVSARHVQSFVSVMCTAYDKTDELANTLKKLVENVSRALELSKSSEKIRHTSTRLPQTSTRCEKPPSPLRYDLDTVIQRKVSSCPDPLPYPTPTAWSPRMDSCEETQTRRNASVLRNLRADGTRVVHHCYTPISCMAVLPDRVVCGLSTGTVIACDPYTCTQTSRSNVTDSNILHLDSHLDAVRTLQTRDDLVVSGSQDGTLCVWSFSNSVRRRGLLHFFSPPTHSEPMSTGSRLRHPHAPSSSFRKEHKISPSSSSYPTTSLSLHSIDTNEISRKCLLLCGHKGPITCAELGASVTTDRTLLFSGSQDTTIRIWETSKATPLATFRNHTGSLSCLRFLPHRDHLVSGCSSHRLKIWDLGALALKHDFIAHHGGLRDIQATGDRLITAANDRTAKVWDLHFRSGHQCTHALGDHSGPVTCIAIGGPAEFNICTGSSDGIVRIWDLRYLSKGPHFAQQCHRGAITCLQRDFTKLISAGEDGALCAMNIRTGICLKQVKAHISGITSLALIHSVVFSASWDGSVCLWSLDVE